MRQSQQVHLLVIGNLYDNASFTWNYDILPPTVEYLVTLQAILHPMTHI